MPGFDGTGPLGEGPMTGRGSGFCVLAIPKEKPSKVRGFAGLQSVPVGEISGYFENTGKEMINMPLGNGTGPVGMGPMTGRAAGFCAGFPVPGYMNPILGRVGFCGTGTPVFAPFSAGLHAYGPGYAYTGWANPWLYGGFGFGRGFGWCRGRRGGRGRGRGRFGYWW